MVRILFVCHGNICRSPMGEYILKDLVKKAGKQEQFQIASAATSREEIGNPVYPPARRKLAEHGISCDGHAARQLQRGDYDRFDLLVGMDMANLRNMHRDLCGLRYKDLGALAKIVAEKLKDDKLSGVYTKKQVKGLLKSAYDAKRIDMSLCTNDILQDLLKL